MKVLRIFHGGGVPEYQKRDDALAALGHDVTLVVPKWFRELPEITVAEPRQDSVRVIPVGLFGPRRNPFFFYNPFTIASVHKSADPDVVDLHEEPYSLAALSVLVGLRLARSSAALIFRSSQNVFKRYPGPFAKLQSAVLKKSAEAYVPSTQAKEVLEKKGFNRRITVVGNGVAIRDSVRAEVPDGGPLKVVYVGRLTERKGVRELVEAVVGLAGTVYLTVVGSGPDGDELVKIAARSSSPQSVTFVGAVPQDEVALYTAAADVICVPSRVLDGWSEQFSRALVEGMASSCVPIVSTSGALNEVSGGSGIVFPWGSVDALRASLVEVAAWPDIHVAKERARAIAQDNYSWEATSAQISSIYERVSLPNAEK